MIDSFYFAPTKVCNLRCKYCYVPEYNKNQQIDYDRKALENTKAFIKKAVEEKVIFGSCCLHGAESTILTPEVLGEIINRFHNLTNKPVRIQTNGVNITKNYLERVLNIIKNPSKFIIGFSIDGPEIIHDVNRQNTYSIVFSNLLSAIELGFKTSILSVINSLTIQNLEAFRTWNVLIDSKEILTHKFKLAEHGFELTYDENIIFAKWLKSSKFLNKLQGFIRNICIHRGNQCMFFEFDIDGNTYACNKNFEDSKSFGNWKTTSFKELIKKRKPLHYKIPIDTGCFNCEYWAKCQGGCPTSRVEGKSIDCVIKKYIWKTL